MVKMDRKLKFWGYDIYIDLESKSLNEYAAFVRKEYNCYKINYSKLYKYKNNKHKIV